MPAMIFVFVSLISPFIACPVVGNKREAPNSLPPTAKAEGDKDANIIKKATE
jgi:hypothetical protein